jgi:hypothetical protein
MNAPLQRRCSFCHQTGHNVNMCNADRLYEFRKVCVANKIICDYDEGSKHRFKVWLYSKSTNNPGLVLAFGSRFFRIPMHVDFVERTEQITDFIYGMRQEEINEIINFNIDTVTRLALTNMNVLSGLFFEERIQYITEITDFLERQKTTTPKKFQIATLLREIKSEHVEETSECSICYNEKMEKDFVQLSCNHQFCGDCILSTVKISIKDPTCPLCRHPITQMSLYDTNIQTEISKYII